MEPGQASKHSAHQSSAKFLGVRAKPSGASWEACAIKATFATVIKMNSCVHLLELVVDEVIATASANKHSSLHIIKSIALDKITTHLIVEVHCHDISLWWPLLHRHTCADSMKKVSAEDIPSLVPAAPTVECTRITCLPRCISNVVAFEDCVYATTKDGRMWGRPQAIGSNEMPNSTPIDPWIVSSCDTSKVENCVVGNCVIASFKLLQIATTHIHSCAANA